MKKLKILLVWVGIVAYIVFALGFVSGEYKKQVYTTIRVKIIDSLENRFVTAEDVTEILLDNGEKLLGYPQHTVNTHELEKLLAEDSFIKSARLYKTVDGALNADIVQRKPILRIINRTGQSYYLDREGMILPLSPNFTSRVPVANGYISEPFNVGSKRSIFEADVPETKRNEVIYDLYALASFIESSNLWRAQITQVYVNNKYEFELIPRVGAHIILLGDASNVEMKFRKLEALYRYGLNNNGWNNYEIINLKYENQVVCTKR